MFEERLGSYWCDIFAGTADLAVGIGLCFYDFSMEKQLLRPTINPKNYTSDVRYQELIMCRGEYLTLYSPVIYDCTEVKQLPFRVT